MALKKLLPVLFLLSASIAYPANKNETPTTQNQAIPSDATPQPVEEPARPGLPEDRSIAPLPSSAEMSTSYESAFVRMLITLLGLIFLVFATFWVLRRMGKGKFSLGSGRSINILEKRALSPKSILYIVEIGNKKILIAESQVEVRALTTYEETPEVGE